MKVVEGPSFQRFVDSLHATGEDYNIGPLALKLGFEKAGAPVRWDEISRPDGTRTSCLVVYEEDETGKRKPVCLVVHDGKRTPTLASGHWWRLSLDGTLEKALYTEGRYEDGKPVRGSGVYKDLDVNSPEVLSAMKAQLSFWMKRYSKLTAKASAGGPTPTAKSPPASSR